MGPLHGLKVIELASIGPGPMCAMLLADLGADVVKLERIDGTAGLERRGTPGPQGQGPLTPRYFYSRAASIYGGTSEVQKDILAKAVVG